jgi:hypothetical protein
MLPEIPRDKKREKLHGVLLLWAMLDNLRNVRLLLPGQFRKKGTLLSSFRTFYRILFFVFVSNEICALLRVISNDGPKLSLLINLATLRAETSIKCTRGVWSFFQLPHD